MSMKLFSLQSICMFLCFASCLAMPLSAQNITKQRDATENPLEKAELEFVNASLTVIKDKPVTMMKNGNELKGYNMTITLYVMNKSQKTCLFPTKIDSLGKTHTSGEDLHRFILNINKIRTCFIPSSRQRVPLVRSESYFDVVELRSGEATIITYETFISEDELEDIEELRFEIFSTHDGRYKFWEGRLESPVYKMDAIMFPKK